MSDASYTPPGAFYDRFRVATATERRKLLKTAGDAIAASGSKLSGAWRAPLTACRAIALSEGATKQADLLAAMILATDDPAVVPAPDAVVWCPHCTGTYPFGSHFGVRNARRTPAAEHAPDTRPPRLGWVLRGGVEEPATDAATRAIADGWRPAVNVACVLDVTCDATGTPVRMTVRVPSRQSQCSRCRPGKHPAGVPHDDAVSSFAL